MARLSKGRVPRPRPSCLLRHLHASRSDGGDPGGAAAVRRPSFHQQLVRRRLLRCDRLRLQVPLPARSSVQRIFGEDAHPPGRDLPCRSWPRTLVRSRAAGQRLRRRSSLRHMPCSPHIENQADPAPPRSSNGAVRSKARSASENTQGPRTPGTPSGAIRSPRATICGSAKSSAMVLIGPAGTPPRSSADSSATRWPQRKRGGERVGQFATVATRAALVA